MFKDSPLAVPALTMKTRASRTALLFTTAAVTILSPLAAHAQYTASEPTSDPAAAQANEIIVTGQRRDQRLQDVPVSVSVISSDVLTSGSPQGLGDLQYLAPSLTFNPQIGAGFQIRGVGSQGFDYNLEKSVATVVDEVVQGLPRNIGLNTLADVDHVEVLSGPQGTLYGKNASAGVVFIATRRPVLGETSLDGAYRYGTDNEAYLENTFNFAVAENAAVRLTGVHQRRDGYMQNILKDQTLGGYSDTQLRAKLLWEPTSALSWYLIGDYQKHSDKGLAQAETFRVFGTGAGAANQQALNTAAGIVAGPGNERMANDGENYARGESRSATSIVTYDMSGHTLTAITAYKDVDFANANDPDNGPSAFLSYNVVNMHASQFSQELRLTSPLGGFFDYVAGLYYYDQRVDADEHQGGLLGRTDLPAGTLSSPVGGVGLYRTSAKSVAAFGQSNFHFTPQLTVSVGLRYTHDKVEGRFSVGPDDRFTLVGAQPAAGGASSTANNVSGRVTVNYKPTDDLMVFGTFSTGYKAPAIGTGRGVITKVAPEEVVNYEVGFKSTWFDGALTVNLVAFYEEFKNFQTQTQQIGSDGLVRAILANAKSLEAYGVEFDTRLRVSDGLTLSLAGAYNPATYTDFLTTCYANQALLASPGNGCYVQPGTTARVYQASGQPLIYSPKTTLTFGLDYERPLGAGYELNLNTSYSYRSAVDAVAGNPNTRIGGYGLLNGKLTVGPDDGRWNVGLYWRNLLDEDFVARIRQPSFSAPGTYTQTPALDARRTVGVSLGFAF